MKKPNLVSLLPPRPCEPSVAHLFKCHSKTSLTFLITRFSRTILVLTMMTSVLGFISPAFAGGTEGHPGKISGKSVGAAAVSLIVWPGLGQLILDNPVDKNVTHALLGLTGVFRFWSCYDAYVDRRGGVWHNRI